jgi:hypothetical protein
LAVPAAVKKPKNMNIFQPIFDVRDLRGGISSLPIANEPIFDVAHLAHVELLTSGPKGTLWYFKDLLGMRSPVPDFVCS